MTDTPTVRPKPSLGQRLSTFLFPPLGLILLWRGPQSIARKVLGSIFILLYGLLYTAAVLALLGSLNLIEIEWKGGTAPRVVHRRTQPDFNRLDASRAQQKQTVTNGVTITNGSAYWADFRGVNRDGHYTQQPILTHWPQAGPTQLWKQPVGGGYASFVIARGRAFTIEQRREKESVVAYDFATGRELWAHGWLTQFNDQWNMGGVGPRATPTWHEGRVYALGAEGEFACLDDTTGRVVWRKNVLIENRSTNLDFGMSAAPLVVGDTVIVTLGGPDGAKGATVVAYDKVSGALAWKTAAGKLAYSSPMLVTLAGRPQILLAGARRALALAPEDGKVLWEFPWPVTYDNNIGQPLLLGGDKVFLSAGYGTGCVAFEVKRVGATFEVVELWRSKQMKNKFSTSVFWEGHIYGLDEDILVCLDVATGQRRWKDGRYGYGQLLLASGHLVILCGDGDLALVKATPERHEELARVPGVKGKTWNHPALADGRLLIRNGAEMACFDLSAPSGPPKSVIVP